MRLADVTAMKLLLVLLQTTAVLAAPLRTGNGYVTCDECTLIARAAWCPKERSCFFYNESVEQDGASSTASSSERRAQSSFDPARDLADCSALCGAPCVGFLECFFGVSDCGDCAFVGGVWCSELGKCFPNAAPAFATAYNCTNECPGGVCINNDNDCPGCTKYRSSIVCNGVSFLVVSSLCTALFLAAIAWTIYAAHRDAAQNEKQAQEDAERVVEQDEVEAETSRRMSQLHCDRRSSSNANASAAEGGARHGGDEVAHSHRHRHHRRKSAGRDSNSDDD